MDMPLELSTVARTMSPMGTAMEAGEGESPRALLAEYRKLAGCSGVALVLFGTAYRVSDLKRRPEGNSPNSLAFEENEWGKFLQNLGILGYGTSIYDVVHYRKRC